MPLFLLTFFQNAKVYVIGGILFICIAALAVHEYNVHSMEGTITAQATKNVTLQVQNQEAVKIVAQQQHDIVLQAKNTKDILTQFNKSDENVETEVKKIQVATKSDDLQATEDFANKETATLFQCIEDTSNDKVCTNE